MNLWFWSKGPMVQPFVKSQLIESDNFWFRSKGPMVQPFMKSHLIESDNFWFWSKGPKIHPFLKCHLTESVDFFIWLSRFPSYWIYQAGVEEPKPHFITAWPHKHPTILQSVTFYQLLNLLRAWKSSWLLLIQYWIKNYTPPRTARISGLKP